MKPGLRTLVILLSCFLALAVSINPLIIFIVREQIRARLPGSTVAISGCQFKPFELINFKGVRVNKASVYDLQIKSLEIGFSPASVFRAFQGDLAGAIESCDISIDTFVFDKIRMSGGYLKVSRTNGNNDLGCSEFRYEKLKILDIKGNAGLEKDHLRIDSLSGRLLGGVFKGEGYIKLDPHWGYQARIDFTNLDLETFMKDFALNEKAEVSGTMSGFLKLRGDDQGLAVMEGNLGSGKDGGILTIKDTEFLQNMARSSGQALDLVVESFKNYRYNTGKTDLTLKGNDLIFRINLEGVAGKRGLNIILHDFNPGRAE